MSRIEGKVAVVTGAGSGIGLAVARRFAAEGASVIVVGRGTKALDQAAAGNPRLEPFVADVTDLAALGALRDHVLAVHGGADILFANAGIFAMAPFADVAEADFDRMIATNLKGSFFTLQAMLPALRDGASVVLTSSAAGVRPLPGASVYSASKAALNNLAQGLSVELRERRIRVNTLSPGNTETAIGLKTGLSQEQLAGFLEHTAADTPLGRNGRVEDMADAALFLASEESRFVTGTDLLIDGGYTRT